ncbi:enoyl-CoA hydratase/isomerase family protein [Actinomadura sp. LOL_016]|uniref:enoyl-CoA hydratase/isomerase family protein n=1 Tax=unclassified Actinomadura TaxID=2626254 RepID=UPI003A81346E
MTGTDDATGSVTTTTPSLAVTLDKQVAVLEIRRPPANYFDEELIGAIVDAALALDENPDCRALVLCSAGKHFCAGADFGAGGDFETDRAAVASKLYRRATGLFQVRKPIVAAVQGAAVGGGMGLACAADFRVADAKTRFVANFATLGFHHGFGLTVTLPLIIGFQRATDLLYRGGTVRGEEAGRIGLADRLTEPGEQREAAIAWARDLAAAAPLAASSIRETMRAGIADRVSEALERELSEQARLWETADCAEGIAAAGERRPPVFTGR